MISHKISGKLTVMINQCLKGNCWKIMRAPSDIESKVL